jgi:hypothetical protein
VIPQLISFPSTDFIFCLLIGTSIGYALIFKAFRKSFVQILKAVNDSNLTYQLYRENARATKLTMMLLASISTVVVGIFISWSVHKLDWLSDFGTNTVLFGILGVALFIMFRYTILNCIGIVSQKKQLLDYGLYVFWSILCFLGPILSGITALAVFGPTGWQQIFIWLGLLFILLSYALFILKGFLICVNEKGIGPLNLIYYFCTLEVLPILLAYRTILN